MENNNDKSIIEIITEAVKERFIPDQQSAEINSLKALAPVSLSKIEVLRLQRISTGTQGWRTLIIAFLNSSKDIDDALQWSASCKDELLDPEASDLYLIIIINEISLTVEECISIEANEKFCRKFILRPDESLNQLMERTFLTPVIEASIDEQILDPFTVALRDTGLLEEWFNNKEQQNWRKIFLSGKIGAELIDQLFGDMEEESLE
ncbi:MAG TPA: ABC-three component system middle component 1 [Cyclobacteriaceae bacterium]|jgi:hypothetical protein|nr:ABC-three component system middle component 1 [Cyclobacteriaceae bacterium]